ncbi:hypothetical protein [Polaribacter sp.]|uniref:hypothetical protein n=1 Tax=Polaribacter sp. TaxID=1920175 RepID=UPI003F6AEDFE
MKYFLSFTILIILFSCAKKQEQGNTEEKIKPLLSVVKEHPSVKPINPIYKEEIESWKELENVDNFLGRFKKASANEVLSNALELKGLITKLKDSIKLDMFKLPSFNARVNILYNETLRLSDMTTIPAITADEVHLQTEKIIDAFSAVNAKVNTIFSKKRFEDEIGVDLTFIGLDSTKMDSVTRKSLKNNVKLTPKN